VKGRWTSPPLAAKETWRLVKSGTLSFSFGYLVPDGRTKLAGGGSHIKDRPVRDQRSCRSPGEQRHPSAPEFKGVQEVVDNLADEQTDLVKELQEVKDRLAKARRPLRT
jgi:hypothetical protein